MKTLTVIGARPQFIKAAPVSYSLKKSGINEILVHTGQHYDTNMSDIFFDELGIPAPAYNLGINMATHGAMTGKMLEKIESILLDEKPDWVMVYGDTNSTLAGALAASKLHIPVAHVEAGLRSFNKKMPEEINRILTDHVSDLLFVPTYAGIENLKNESITRGVTHIGDVMYDAALVFGEFSDRKSNILQQLDLTDNNFALATIHRAENTDNPKRMESIFRALLSINKTLPVLLPLHPRTEKLLQQYEMQGMTAPLCITQPVSYLDMVFLEKKAKVIITDSGGVQKEGYFHKTPCVTLRDETEWTETVSAGWNQIAGADTEKIISAVKNAKPGSLIDDYGQGDAAQRIVDIFNNLEIE